MNPPELLPAALAGLLSFLSPCVLPLVPAYLSFISGASAAEVRSGDRRRKVFTRSLAFSAGFALAFTVMGVVFSGGALFVGGGGKTRVFEIAGGVVVALLGLNLIFDFVHVLGQDSRLIARFAEQSGQGRPAGAKGAFILGLAFASGWSPCIGPILASILIFAGKDGNILKAAALLGSYSAGFALPFLAAGLFFDRLKPLLSYFSRHGREVRIVSGVILAAFGIMMALGGLGRISALASQAGYMLEDFALAKPRLSMIIGALLWAMAAAAAWGLGEKPRKNPKVRLSVALLFISLAASELLGLLHTLSIISGWLTFSGI